MTKQTDQYGKSFLRTRQSGDRVNRYKAYDKSRLGIIALGSIATIGVAILGGKIISILETTFLLKINQAGYGLGCFPAIGTIAVLILNKRLTNREEKVENEAYDEEYTKY